MTLTNGREALAFHKIGASAVMTPLRCLSSPARSYSEPFYPIYKPSVYPFCPSFHRIINLYKVITKCQHFSLKNQSVYPCKKSKRNYYYHPHFTDKKTKAERSKLVALVNSRARI